MIIPSAHPLPRTPYRLLCFPHLPISTLLANCIRYCTQCLIVLAASRRDGGDKSGGGLTEKPSAPFFSKPIPYKSPRFLSLVGPRDLHSAKTGLAPRVKVLAQGRVCGWSRVDCMNPCYGIKIRNSLFPVFFKRPANHRACARCMYGYLWGGNMFAWPKLT